MTVQGTFVDVTRVSFATATTAALFAAVTHSLGADPSFVLAQAVSVGAASASPALLAFGHNASRTTVGLSACTLNVDACPTVAADVVSWLLHSAIK